MNKQKAIHILGGRCKYVGPSNYGFETDKEYLFLDIVDKYIQVKDAKFDKEFFNENFIKMDKCCNTSSKPIERLSDNVHHPSHYADNAKGIECIDAMEAAFGSQAVQCFCICNAFKYLFRYTKKNGIEDIHKAQWYINKYIELNE
jgi:hypothetical protein